MLARFIRYSLLLELAAYAALGAWLHAALGWSIPALVAAAIVVALGARFALVCVTGFLGWLNCAECAPEHRIGLVGVPRYLLGEYRAVLADNFWYLPWESLALRTDPVPAPGGGVPVILVHGYLSNRGYFKPLVQFLEGQGIGPVIAPNFPVLFTSIEHFAQVLHEEIERVATASSQPRVYLVCHSMGGLAARRYLHDHGAGRVAKLVTIASPHCGTALAAIGLGTNARQMYRKSEFLCALEAAEAAAPPGVDMVSIWSPHDNLVAPQDTSLLPWARSYAVPGVGHVEIIGSPRAFAAVAAELAR
jgi:hypothetical protein